MTYQESSRVAAGPRSDALPMSKTVMIVEALALLQRVRP